MSFNNIKPNIIKADQTEQHKDHSKLGINKPAIHELKKRAMENSIPVSRKVIRESEIASSVYQLIPSQQGLALVDPGYFLKVIYC